MKLQVRDEIARFYCPGCKGDHWVNIEDAWPVWTFNGDTEKPTLHPSVVVTYNGEDADQEGCQPSRCHSWVRDGQIEFLSDCTHALAGQTVELPDVG